MAQGRLAKGVGHVLEMTFRLGQVLTRAKENCINELREATHANLEGRPGGLWGSGQ